jgi:hypothetical protein
VEGDELVTTTVLFGDLRTGRIRGEIDADTASWAQVLNGAGSVDQVAVADEVIRRLDLRRAAPAARSFLAFEVDDRIQEAGPIWSRSYDWENGRAVLGASGLWSLFDYRKVIPVLATGQRVQGATTALSGADLGELARALVAQAMTHVGGDLPVVLPTPRPGTAATETFPGWKLLDVGQQLTEFTQRETAAPDIAFRPRRRADDRRFIEWVMQTGTGTRPQLSQVGADWVYDTTARESPVLGIGTDEDATAMGMRAWVAGNGTEADMLIASAYDPTLVDAGWPLLEQEESRSSVELQTTLDGHAVNLRDRSARPIEVYKLAVHASAATEVAAGDYARVRTKDHPWLGTGAHRMRVQKKSGTLADRVVLDMYPLQAVL